MKNKRLLTGIFSTLLLSTLSAHAEPLDLRLGLWETTETTQTSGSLIPESALKKMPPDQRARMEAMMKKRQAQAPQSHTIKSCLTQEKLNQQLDKRKIEGDEKCIDTIVTATRTVQETKFQCTGSDSRSGVMHTEALSRERTKSTIKINSSHNTVNVEMTGRWIAADCGKERD